MVELSTLEKGGGGNNLDILPANSTHSGFSQKQNASQANRCPNGNGFTVEIKLNNGNTRYMPDRCDNWNCPYCSVVKARIIAGRLHQAISKYPNWMIKSLTLTVDTNLIPPDIAEKSIPGAWNKLKVAMERKYGKFPFFWVKDYTQNGYIHLHILIITKAWIDENHLNQHYTLGRATVALAGNNMGEVRRTINYFIKRLRTSQVKPGKKRWNSSRSFLPPQYKSAKGSTRVLTIKYDDIVQQMAGQIKTHDSDFIEI